MENQDDSPIETIPEPEVEADAKLASISEVGFIPHLESNDPKVQQIAPSGDLLVPHGK